MSTLTCEQSTAPPLFNHDVTTEPDPLVAGKAKSVVYVKITPKTKDVYCSRVTVDLKAQGLTPISGDLTGAQIAGTAYPGGRPWHAEPPHGSQFTVYYANAQGDEALRKFGAGDCLLFRIRGLTPDNQTGDTGVRVTECSTPDGTNATSKPTDCHLTRASGGTVFRGFGPLLASDARITRNQRATLTWEANLPDYDPGSSSNGAYYTLEVGYNGQTKDVTTDHDTDRNGRPIFTTPPLGATTLFNLTLRLYRSDRTLQSTHIQQALIVVARTDLIVNDLTVSGPVRILNPRSRDVPTGRLLAGTDGFLHCQVWSTGGAHNALQINLEGVPPYTISTNKNVARLLLPIPKGNYVTIDHPPQYDSLPWECVWHPLGAGPLSNTRVFTTADTDNEGNVTWTIPGNITEATLELWGPGGAGRRGDTLGGAGAYLKDTIPVTPGHKYIFHIGKANDHTRVLDPDGNLLLLAAGGGHAGGPTATVKTQHWSPGGPGGAGWGYADAGEPHIRGGAGGGSARGPANGAGGYNTTGGSGGEARDGKGLGGQGWHASGGDGDADVGGGGAGPGRGHGGRGGASGGGGGGVSGGTADGTEPYSGAGKAGGQGGYGRGGGGAGGNGWGHGESGPYPWGANGAGGGGGGARGGVGRETATGGGGSQGWSYLRDPSRTFYDGGVGAKPAGNPPTGIAESSGDGAVRVTWVTLPPEDTGDQEPASA